MKFREDVSVERLREVLFYDCVSGGFFWKISPAKNVRAGSAAGYLEGKGYITISVDKMEYRAHRLAWLYTYGAWPKQNIDHINHNRSDNRIDNLREANIQENGKNRILGKNNKSGVIGVSFKSNRKKPTWTAQIAVDKERIHLGTFDNIFDAACARKSAEVEHNFHPNHGGV